MPYRYLTDENLNKISKENKKLYDKYLRSSIIKNKDTKETTYRTYKNSFYHFMLYLCLEWDNISLYSQDFIEEAVDIIEGFIAWSQEKGVNKKAVNNKIVAVSSFYIWSVKRGLIDTHPFLHKLDRVKGAKDEKIRKSYFLTMEQIMEIRIRMELMENFDIQDQIIWEIFLDSGNRMGAISKLPLSKLNLEDGQFEDIREKHGKIVDIIFYERAKKLIIRWLEIRKELDGCQVDSLLVTKYRGEWRQMAKQTIWERVRKMGRLIGIDDLYPHSLRKTSINLIRKLTGSIEEASQFAGHSGLTVTKDHYIEPISKKKQKARIKQLREEKGWN
jgi:integrase/recombinase XerC